VRKRKRQGGRRRRGDGEKGEEEGTTKFPNCRGRVVLRRRKGRKERRSPMWGILDPPLRDMVRLEGVRCKP